MKIKVYENLWDAGKPVLRKIFFFTVVKPYSKKKEKSQVNNLTI